MSKVIWCDKGWQPVFIGFCPSKKAWNKEMKRIGIKNEPYPTSDGRCTQFTNTKYGNIALVTVKKNKRSSLEVIGLINHEAVHVWQFIKEIMGESNPSIEFEAYSIQAITMSLINAYEQSRGKLTK